MSDDVLRVLMMNLQILTLLPNGILAVWPSSLALKEFAFLTVNIHLMTAVLYVFCLFGNIRVWLTNLSHL